jgi:hypothetical protein
MEGDVEGDPESGEEAQYDPLRDSPEALEARRAWTGGAIMLVVGTTLGVGALAMRSSDPCARPWGNSCNVHARNRASLAMGMPGLVILAGGIALLTLGIVRRRRLEASLAAGSRGAHFMLGGRF